MPKGRPLDPNDIAWVALDRVEQVHDAILKSYGGGLSGYPHPSRLDSAIHAPQQSLHYDESGRCDLYDLAATYLYHIAKAHAFTDGNKRTAYVTALYFLYINGIDLQLPKQRLALARATERAAKNELTKKDIAKIIRWMPRPDVARPVLHGPTGEYAARPKRRRGKRKSGKRIL